MRNVKSFYLIICLLLIFISCATPVQIQYSVAAHHDPTFHPNSSVSTFALKPLSVGNEPDPIIENNLLYLVEQGLTKRGWQKVSLEKAEFIFQVDFAMQERQYDYQTGIYTWYDTKGRAYHSGGGGGTETVYRRQVKITVYKKTEKDISQVWTADCRSTGNTPDILIAAKYMVPHAITVFPEEGVWNKIEKIK